MICCCWPVATMIQRDATMKHSTWVRLCNRWWGRLRHSTIIRYRSVSPVVTVGDARPGAVFTIRLPMRRLDL